MKNIFSHLVCLVAVVFLACSLGCGGSSNIGEVTGVLTLEGEPLANARVTFYPAVGRASQGISDSSGRYELKYLRKQKGAVVGEHRVTVSTEVPDVVDYRGETAGQSGDEANETIIKGEREGLKKKYYDRDTTELRATVVPGYNEFNYDLEKRKRRKRRSQ